MNRCDWKLLKKAAPLETGIKSWICWILSGALWYTTQITTPPSLLTPPFWNEKLILSVAGSACRLAALTWVPLLDCQPLKGTVLSKFTPPAQGQPTSNDRWCGTVKVQPPCSNVDDTSSRVPAGSVRLQLQLHGAPWVWSCCSCFPVVIIQRVISGSVLHVNFTCWFPG